MELYSFVNVVKGTSNVVPTLNGGYSKRAYVTFLVGNGDYVKGVVALVKCLRKVKSAYPLVVAVMPDVPEDHRKALRCQGCVVHELIEPICPPESQIPIERIHSEALYSKLCVWTLEKYSKMIYLDADILVVDNIDHLFDLPDGYFYAVPDCFCENTWSHSPQHSIGYCQLCPNKVRWPTEMGSPLSLYFNSGIFVFEPSRETYQSMLKTLQITPPGIFPDQVSYSMI
ncbi:Galactinol synthase 1 [Camellia lanceoleosa]|uniref:Galactinol synthase 1 n=1 Tax=Camellia lanceoleosa TaxID=1840588 RepID=A0ACC0GB50_9ERIC|nr:Galactinol synthase 1 [Camellia lanceoleosa]